MLAEFINANRYIDVYEASRLRSHMEGKILLSDMTRLQDLIVPSKGSIDFAIDGIVGDKGWPGAVMVLKGDIPVICNRCNEEMTFSLEREVVFRFARSEAEADSIPIEEDDDVEIVVGSTKLNLLDWIEEEVLLSLPLVPMHETECTKHMQTSSVEKEEKVNPFAELGKLKNLRKVQ